MIIYRLVVIILILIIICILLYLGDYLLQYQKEIDYVYKKIKTVNDIENKIYEYLDKFKTFFNNLLSNLFSKW